MSRILKHPVDTAAAWLGSNLEQDDSWIHHWTAADLQAIDTALQHSRVQARPLAAMTAADFPVPSLSEKLGRIANELEVGKGFCLLRGLPIERYSEKDIDTIYYGLGLNLGQPVTQNPRGDLIGCVMNVGDKNNKQTRVYETNAYLPYHTDPSDVVGLLCVRQARRGGLSSLVSASSVYNRIVAHHPEFLALLYRPMYYAHLGNNRPGLSPIFSYHDNKLSCRYLRQYIELGHDMMELPLSAIERDALDLLDAILNDTELRLDMMLEPGDLQLANNYVVMHSRTAFEDADDPAAHRKMLRLWLQMPNARSLAPDFPGRNGFGAPRASSVQA